MKYRPGEGATARARNLRQNATDAEKALWRLLRESFPEAHFRRQVPLRSFTPDFASHRAKIVIEVDGGQHEPIKETGRTTLIETEGYRVLRFWNNEVLGNPDGVWQRIADALHGPHPHPTIAAAGSSPGRAQERPRSHQGGGL
jgi:very-short-patch-repair endonuclease